MRLVCRQSLAAARSRSLLASSWRSQPRSHGASLFLGVNCRESPFVRPLSGAGRVARRLVAFPERGARLQSNLSPARAPRRSAIPQARRGADPHSKGVRRTLRFGILFGTPVLLLRWVSIRLHQGSALRAYLSGSERGAMAGSVQLVTQDQSAARISSSLVARLRGTPWSNKALQRTGCAGR